MICTSHDRHAAVTPGRFERITEPRGIGDSDHDQVLYVASLLLLCFAQQARAQIQIAWTDCLEDGGPRDRTFACSSDAGANRLVVSYIMPSNLTGFLAVDAAIHLWANDGSVPVWWDLRNSGP